MRQILPRVTRRQVGVGKPQVVLRHRVIERDCLGGVDGERLAVASDGLPQILPAIPVDAPVVRQPQPHLKLRPLPPSASRPLPPASCFLLPASRLLPPVSLSPCLLVSVSPCPLVPLSLRLQLRDRLPIRLNRRVLKLPCPRVVVQLAVDVGQVAAQERDARPVRCTGGLLPRQPPLIERRAPAQFVRWQQRAVELVQQLGAHLGAHRRWCAGRLQEGLEEEQPAPGGEDVGRVVRHLAQRVLGEPEDERHTEAGQPLPLEVECPQRAAYLLDVRALGVRVWQVRHVQARVGQLARVHEHDRRARALAHALGGGPGRVVIALAGPFVGQPLRQLPCQIGPLRREFELNQVSSGLCRIGTIRARLNVLPHVAHQQFAQRPLLAHGEEERASRADVQRVAQER